MSELQIFINAEFGSVRAIASEGAIPLIEREVYENGNRQEKFGRLL